MSKSFFGGDPNVAHFTVGVRYRTSKDEGHKEQRERRATQAAKLKELGFGQPRYFQFPVKDEVAKELKRDEAVAYAASWSERAGFELEVSEGCFL